jgi:hypothetical protein
MYSSPFITQEIMYSSPFIMVVPLSFGHEAEHEQQHEQQQQQQQQQQHSSLPDALFIRSATAPPDLASSNLTQHQSHPSPAPAALAMLPASSSSSASASSASSTTTTTCPPPSLSSALILWCFAPLIISIISECLVTHSGIAHIRAYNIIDICLATPLHIAIAHHLILSLQLPPHHAPIAWSSWCLFLFGRGVHTAADAAYSLITEISPSLAAATPPPLLSCLHMLDEHIGHLLLWAGYFAFWAALLHGSRLVCPLHARPCAAAVLMGTTHAVALIESSHPELCILVILLAVIAFRAKFAPLLLRVFTLIFAVSLIAAMAAYRVVLGSLRQPSEMGGVFATARVAVGIIVGGITSCGAGFVCAGFGVCSGSAEVQEM